MKQEELFKWMQEHKGLFLEYDTYEEWSKSSFIGQEKTLKETYQEWKNKTLTGKNELENYNKVFNETNSDN